jgi:hypothetical protein
VKFFLLALFCFANLASGLAQQSKVLSVGKLKKLAPIQLEGYTLKESNSSRLKLGKITYTLCDRIFENREKKLVKILLFDYAEAPIMYNQAIQKWGQIETVETDSVLFRKTNSEFFKGWESYTSHNSHSQIILGIHERFFLILSGEHVALTELKTILAQFKLDQFPE